MSGNVAQPLTSNLNVGIIDQNKLPDIVNYYKLNRKILLPKLQELQVILNYFMNEEPKL